MSFVTIGVIWINHHAMLRRVQTVDHSVLVCNLLLLMLIAVLPWTTALLAEYLREDDGQHLAAAIYGGSLLAMALRSSRCSATCWSRGRSWWCRRSGRRSARRSCAATRSGCCRT